jgi:hypothetical protein
MEASCPPDHPVEEFTIKFIRDQESGNWWAHCLEWKCDVYADTATEAAQKITGDIDDHNDKCAMQVLEAALDQDPNMVLEELCKLIK